MEDVLDLYAEEYDLHYPVVCFDESPYQLVREIRTPLPLEKGKPRRYDYEYKREGSCNLFLFFQPLAGWRHVDVTERRTAKDYAQCMKELVDVHFPDAILISVVQDNLNTHSGAALYEAFEPVEARRILNKLEFRYTPKHGSWLNMAECEFAILLGQCLDQRIPAISTVRRKSAAWEQRRNATKATVKWRFTTAVAREKLKRIYPS
jgi:transposase